MDPSSLCAGFVDCHTRAPCACNAQLAARELQLVGNVAFDTTDRWFPADDQGGRVSSYTVTNNSPQQSLTSPEVVPGS